MAESMLLEHLENSYARLQKASTFRTSGRLVRMVGLTLEASGCRAPVGTKCLVECSDGRSVTAEVVGFSDHKLFLMTSGDVQGLAPGAAIIPLGTTTDVAVGDALLGRVVDGAGQPLDDQGPINTPDSVSLLGGSINPLQRACVRRPLDVGVRALNGLFTVGRGQRMGLFAGSGVGKSVLMGMMTKFTEAEVVVVGLVGERGREVKEFIEDILGEIGLQNSVVVAAPADASPLMRIHGAMRATSIAEYFRDQGKHVLLLLDSLTRFAQAQRELSLAIGEPPATKGYPPSVFSKLSQLVERAGNSHEGGGSITAFYTVLTEGDDQQDPIADSARSFLDGHIVLSRALAETGVYPAIDVEKSISRVMPNVTDKAQQKFAQSFKATYSTYHSNEDLISIGAYQSGSNPAIDNAISMHTSILEYIQQDLAEGCNYENSTQLLSTLMASESTTLTEVR